MNAGFLVVDKPAGVTSHDIVAIARAVLGIKKVGHTGTLDPFATGVLPLALGPATKLIQYLDEDLKIYDASIGLGARTDTGDPTGTVEEEAPVPELTLPQIDAVLESFAGVRQQVPPRYSAVKINGRPLYSYARAGEAVEAKARPIRIDLIERVSFVDNVLRVRIHCGRGTYARVLAEEIAVCLGTVGHLVALRRDRSGPFMLDGSLDLPTLSEVVADRRDWQPVLRPARGAERVSWAPRADVRAFVTGRLITPAVALQHLPCVDVPEAIVKRVRNGSRPPLPEGAEVGAFYRVMQSETLVALAQRKEDGGRSIKVLPPDQD